MPSRRASAQAAARLAEAARATGSSPNSIASRRRPPRATHSSRARRQHSADREPSLRDVVRRAHRALVDRRAPCSASRLSRSIHGGGRVPAGARRRDTRCRRAPRACAEQDDDVALRQRHAAVSIASTSSSRPTIADGRRRRDGAPVGLVVEARRCRDTTGTSSARQASPMPRTAASNCPMTSGFSGLPKLRQSVTRQRLARRRRRRCAPPRRPRCAAAVRVELQQQGVAVARQREPAARALDAHDRRVGARAAGPCSSAPCGRTAARSTPRSASVGLRAAPAGRRAESRLVTGREGPAAAAQPAASPGARSGARRSTSGADREGGRRLARRRYATQPPSR